MKTGIYFLKEDARPSTTAQLRLPRIGRTASTTGSLRIPGGLALICLFVLPSLLGMPISLQAQAPCTTPSNVTATPSTICSGASTNLNATSVGNNIDWYTVMSGGSAIGTSASGANFSVSPSSTTTYYAEAVSTSGSSGTQTFNYTGAVQNFTVPSGITTLTVDVIGASGGAGYPLYSNGGNGGRVTGTIAVTPGQSLQIYVGGAGANANGVSAAAGGYNGGGLGGVYSGSYGGGGGGGASDIRSSPYALANRLVVAGGGGGGGLNYFSTNYDRGGNGGGTTGESGYGGNNLAGQGAGTGGTQAAGGTGGTYSGWCTASNGALGLGGAGGTCTNGGGGGGGGYYGGGGATWAGGGGGSSFLSGGTHTQGYQTGNGQVVISWSGGGGCTASTRVPVTVTVNITSTAPTGILGATTICVGSSVTLTQSGGSAGSGAAFNWYTGSCGGTLVGTGASINVSPTSTTTYYVRAEGTCNTTACASGTVTVSAIPSVSGVTATPPMICPGGTSNLNASGTGTGIDWYTMPSGGTVVGSSAIGANFPVTPSATTTYYAEAVAGSISGSQTFNYTGAIQSFTVPGGVTTLHIDARGAQGGGSNGGAGGLGARMTGDFAVTPGQVLSIVVGEQGLLQQGGNAQNSSGGGGGTFVYSAGPTLLVAAGGGGGKCNYSGSSPLHSDAAGQVTTSGGASSDGNPGGTSGQGGPAGLWSGTPCAGGGTGWLSNGGGPYGGIGYNTWTGGPGFCGGGGGGCGGVGGFGGGGGGGNHYGGGGGGGGYSGGGGGTDPTHGGGGGSFSSGSSQVNTAGFQTGNGQVIFTWNGAGCVSASRVPVTVYVDTIAPVAVCQAVTVTLDANGNGSTTAAAVDNGSSDNCGVDTITLSQTSFTCANGGVNTLTLTVTDEIGNTSTCAASVTVLSSTLTSSIDTLATPCGYNVTCHGGSDGFATATGLLGCGSYTFAWSNGGTSAIISGVPAGTYTVTVTDGSGATSVSSITLTEPPAVIANEVTTPSCTDQTSGSIDISPTGGNSCLSGYTFNWSTGATTEDVTGLAPGSYTVTITDAGGCASTHTITVPALPTPAPTFNVSGNVLTSAQTWVTYQWLLNGSNISGATSNTYTATQSGNYSLSVTDTNGCTGVSTPVQVTVIGVADAMGDWEDLTLYPNPAHGEFRLQTEVPIAYPITVNIHDMLGHRLYMQGLPELGREASFDIKSLAAGTYMVEVVSEEGQRKLFRLVVQ